MIREIVAILRYAESKGNLHGELTPTIYGDEDGALIVEWSPLADAQLTISFPEDGEIAYAALIGDKKNHGNVEIEFIVGVAEGYIDQLHERAARGVE